MAISSDVLSASEIATFTRKLQATVALAEHALKLQQLVAGAARAPVAAPSRIPSAEGTPAPKRRKPSMAVEPVLAALKEAKDGASLSELAARLGEKNLDRVASALRKLREQKKTLVKGERLANWYAA